MAKKIGETNVQGLLDQETKKETCNPAKDDVCDPYCRRDLRDPDCGQTPAEKAKVALQFYGVGAGLSLPIENFSGVSLLKNPTLWLLILLIGAIAGLLFFLADGFKKGLNTMAIPR